MELAKRVRIRQRKELTIVSVMTLSATQVEPSMLTETCRADREKLARLIKCLVDKSPALADLEGPRTLVNDSQDNDARLDSQSNVRDNQRININFQIGRNSYAAVLIQTLPENSHEEGLDLRIDHNEYGFPMWRILRLLRSSLYYSSSNRCKTNISWDFERCPKVMSKHEMVNRISSVTGLDRQTVAEHGDAAIEKLLSRKDHRRNSRASRQSRAGFQSGLVEENDDIDGDSFLVPLIVSGISAIGRWFSGAENEQSTGSDVANECEEFFDWNLIDDWE